MVRYDQQSRWKFVSVLLEQLLFGSLFNICGQQNVLVANADAQHAASVVVADLRQVVTARFGVQYLEDCPVPLP